MALDIYKDCREACHACLVAAERAVAICIQANDHARTHRCIDLNRSCAEICEFTLRQMARGSILVEDACEWCAEVCEACAEECDEHAEEALQLSAQLCRSCVKACRDLAEAPRIADQ